jgi:hypothetical protein
MSDSESYDGFTDLENSIILENKAKGIQYRFTISSFRGKDYIGIREWYMDFEGEYAPSKNGITMPYNLHTTSRLYSSLADVLSKAEVLEEVKKEAVASEKISAGTTKILE